ncbi:Na+/H+ antiporter subunit E [Massilibacterium senegalense]|uniref:Na+/H+ antiporter subunit E n=1 Tax=Massilibacterium senegalense TaxID=1632858 RepID=UPI000784549A|nr:Na+/H+ antiporter subunit E [Massilibacterium senegalense]
MAFQIILNILIAIMWMFLAEEYTFSKFVVGYIFGVFILILLDRFIPDRLYLHRVKAIIKLLFLFIKELILANVDVIKRVYSPSLNIEPGIFQYPTQLKSNWEITLLANLITLTPGTLTVAISNDNQSLYIHSIDVSNVEESIYQIKNTFEKAIMEVTR